MKNSKSKNNTPDPAAQEKRTAPGMLDGVDPVQLLVHWSRLGLDYVIKVCQWIGIVLAWALKMCRIPFRFIPVGFSYAVVFCIFAFALLHIYWTGDGAKLMKNVGDLVPAIQKNNNEISFRESNVDLFLRTLDDEKNAVFLNVRKEYADLLKKAETINAIRENTELEEEARKEQEEQLAEELSSLRKQLLRNAMPLTGIAPDAFDGIHSVAVKPEILEVTIAVINVNQGTPQHFTFHLYDPATDVAAGIYPQVDAETISKRLTEWQEAQLDLAGATPATAAEYAHLEWKLENLVAAELCHRIYENRSFSSALDEATKQKDVADKAADKLKDEEKRNAIKSKRVEDYFCDPVNAQERLLLKVFSGAVNKEGDSANSDNQHETEKVYIYVNRIPRRISVGFNAIRPMVLSKGVLALAGYPEDDFAFSRDDVSNLQACFDNVNSRMISPEEQSRKIRAFLKRDIVAEELEKINAQLAAEADRANRINQERIENKIQLTISQRPEGMKALTEEGRQNIREEVIREMGLKPVIPSLRLRKDVTVEEKVRWIENALAAEGITPANFFYTPLVIEAIRENNGTRSADIFLGGGFLITVVILLFLCALVSLATAIGKWIIVIREKTGDKFPAMAWLQEDNRYYILLHKIAFYAIPAGLLIFIGYWCCLLWALCDVPDQVLAVITEKELFQPEEKTLIWLHYFFYWLPGFILWGIAILVYFMAGTRAALMQEKKDAKIFTILACRTENGGFTRSFYWTTFVLIVLLIMPYLVDFQYLGLLKNPFAPNQENYIQQDAYNIPGGGGDAAPAQPVVVKKKKKKKVKKYIVNPRTSIIFDIPDLNDEEHLEELDAATETQYTTGTMFGKGKKKGKPGWAGGMEDAKIRFIRLQYSGNSWDWNMGKGADFNMLIYLRDKVGFKIANDTESVTVNKLARGFRKGKKPPFVYLTGHGAINLSATEVKQLNEYLLKDGGMIFADNAGGDFDHHFRAMMKRVLPNHKLVEIANDDPIYTAPYFFPNGAPRFIHHSRNNSGALGIKNNGRWVVFYHQGDIGDAWKGAGLTEQQRTDAFKMGANVISYAFGAYLENLSQE